MLIHIACDDECQGSALRCETEIALSDERKDGTLKAHHRADKRIDEDK